MSLNLNTGPAPLKPATRKSLKGAGMKKPRTQNYLGIGAANSSKGREKFAKKGARKGSPFRVPTF